MFAELNTGNNIIKVWDINGFHFYCFCSVLIFGISLNQWTKLVNGVCALVGCSFVVQYLPLSEKHLWLGRCPQPQICPVLLQSVCTAQRCWTTHYLSQRPRRADTMGRLSESRTCRRSTVNNLHIQIGPHGNHLYLNTIYQSWHTL